MVNSEKRVKGLQEHLKRNNGERWVKTNYLSPEHMARRAAIVEAKLAEPSITLQALGDRFGLTRERIRQILITEGIITRRVLKTKDCKYCGQAFIERDAFKAKQSTTYCSPECRTNAHRVYLICDTCDTLYFLKASDYRGRQRYQRFDSDSNGVTSNYCSIKCRGEGAGKKLRKASEEGRGFTYDWTWGKSKDGVSIKIKKAIAKECNISVSYLYHMIRGRIYWRTDVYEVYMRYKENIS